MRKRKGEAMKLLGRHVGKRAMVRVWVPLVGVTLIMGLDAPVLRMADQRSHRSRRRADRSDVKSTSPAPDFNAVTSVEFDGAGASSRSVSATVISAVVPATATGPATVEVFEGRRETQRRTLTSRWRPRRAPRSARSRRRAGP